MTPNDVLQIQKTARARNCVRDYCRQRQMSLSQFCKITSGNPKLWFVADLLHGMTLRDDELADLDTMIGGGLIEERHTMAVVRTEHQGSNTHPWTEEPGWTRRVLSSTDPESLHREALRLIQAGWSVWVDGYNQLGEPTIVMIRKDSPPDEEPAKCETSLAWVAFRAAESHRCQWLFEWPADRRNWEVISDAVRDAVLAPLVEFFRGEGGQFGREGDDRDWDPQRCAIETIRGLVADCAVLRRQTIDQRVQRDEFG